MRKLNPKMGYAFGTAYVVFALICMSKMAGGMLAFLNPIGMLFAIWVIAPIAMTTWYQVNSKLWWIAMMPTGILGASALYDMAFKPGSSTAALGLIFVPLYQWALIGLVGLLILLTASARKRSETE